jgi:hypothetical protein
VLGFILGVSSQSRLVTLTPADVPAHWLGWSYHHNRHPVYDSRRSLLLARLGLAVPYLTWVTKPSRVWTTMFGQLSAVKQCYSQTHTPICLCICGTGAICCPAECRPAKCRFYRMDQMSPGQMLPTAECCLLGPWFRPLGASWMSLSKCCLFTILNPS